MKTKKSIIYLLYCIVGFMLLTGFMGSCLGPFYEPVEIEIYGPSDGTIFPSETKSIPITGRVISGHGEAKVLKALTTSLPFIKTIPFDKTTGEFEYDFPINTDAVLSTCTFEVIDNNLIVNKTRVTYAVSESADPNDGVDDALMAKIDTGLLSDIVKPAVNVLIDKWIYEILYGYNGCSDSDCPDKDVDSPFNPDNLNSPFYDEKSLLFGILDLTDNILPLEIETDVRVLTQDVALWCDSIDVGNIEIEVIETSPYNPIQIQLRISDLIAKGKVNLSGGQEIGLIDELGLEDILDNLEFIAKLSTTMVVSLELYMHENNQLGIYVNINEDSMEDMVLDVEIPKLDELFAKLADFFSKLDGVLEAIYDLTQWEDQKICIPEKCIEPICVGSGDLKVCTPKKCLYEHLLPGHIKDLIGSDKCIGIDDFDVFGLIEDLRNEFVNLLGEGALTSLGAQLIIEQMQKDLIRQMKYELRFRLEYYLNELFLKQSDIRLDLPLFKDVELSFWSMVGENSIISSSSYDDVVVELGVGSALTEGKAPLYSHINQYVTTPADELNYLNVDRDLGEHLALAVSDDMLNQLIYNFFQAGLLHEKDVSEKFKELLQKLVSDRLSAKVSLTVPPICDFSGKKRFPAKDAPFGRIIVPNIMIDIDDLLPMPKYYGHKAIISVDLDAALKIEITSEGEIRLGIDEANSSTKATILYENFFNVSLLPTIGVNIANSMINSLLNEVGTDLLPDLNALLNGLDELCNLKPVLSITDSELINNYLVLKVNIVNTHIDEDETDI